MKWRQAKPLCPISGSLCDALRYERQQPPREEDYGGGDICSLEETPSTEDDQPLE
jgi:hypothetical protein